MAGRTWKTAIVLVATMVLVAQVAWAEEVVGPPLPPVGPTQGVVGVAYGFTASGASSTDGHLVQYQFDWGDGTGYSGWLTGPVDASSHTFATPGTYQVRAQARCLDHRPDITGNQPGEASQWSAAASITLVIETITTPTVAGPATGLVLGSAYQYTASGSVINDPAFPGGDHQVEYQFSFDGAPASWSLNDTMAHAWTTAGPHTVTVQARCATHPLVLSPVSAVLNVTAVDETVAAPSTPAGPASGLTLTDLSYTTGGGSSSLGHALEYRFDWGDGTYSHWSSHPVADHNWLLPGTYQVTAQARCSEHTTHVSPVSASLAVTISQETVTLAGPPEGPTYGEVGTAYGFTALGATSSAGHTVQYRFNWGDGTFSAWSGAVASGTGTFAQTHTWATTGISQVSIQARCATHLTASAWSPAATIAIEDHPETVTVPFAPSGPSRGVPGTTYLFTVTGATSTESHELEYQIDWGDGTLSHWFEPEAEVGHLWGDAGGYTLRARARCRDHRDDLSGDQPGPVSGWSATTPMTIAAETVGTLTPPVGPTSGFVAVFYDFNAGQGTSSDGHVLEYQFDWDLDGDHDPATGILSAWTEEQTVAKGWPAGGTYHVRNRARCRDHHAVTGGWSTALVVTIIDETVSTPGTPLALDAAPFVVDTEYDFSTAGAVSSLGHTVEYRLDWGNGQFSSWSSSGTFTNKWPFVDPPDLPTLPGELPISFTVRAQARCLDHPNVMSGWSNSLTVTIVAESITAPTITGPASGQVDTPYNFTAVGALSNGGHPLIYVFEFGDGASDLFMTATASHAFERAGVFQVRAKARCLVHDSGGLQTDSPWSSPLTFTIPESVSAPARPTGPTIVQQNIDYDFQTTGAVSNAQHAVQYRFDWGDGTFSDWGSLEQTHRWAVKGSYNIRVQARCATDTAVVSAWSDSLGITVTDPEVVSIPFTPAGPVSGVINTSYIFSAVGAESSFGHDLQYQFDWDQDGDHSPATGTLSGWSGISQGHDWPAAGTYHVRARARCEDDPAVTSGWSNALVVAITQPETVSRPIRPAGPVAGVVDTFYLYESGGAYSSDGHELEYRFEWGDGNTSVWKRGDPETGLVTADHGWINPGSYQVRVRARCAQHTSIESVLSDALTVLVSRPETVSRPFAPVGVTAGVLATEYRYQVGGSATSDAHQVEYRIDWDDDGDQNVATGGLSAWSSEIERGHMWSTTGSKRIRVQARCLDHNSIVSAWSDYLQVTIAAETVTGLAAPTGTVDGIINAVYEYATAGASSNDGHPLEYQFIWGDGTVSQWSASLTATHGWPGNGTYQVRVRARCQDHPGIVSADSAALTVTIITESITTPSPPTGPVTAVFDTFYSYTAGGAVSSRGDPLQYRFDWGDGVVSGWLDVTSEQHSWSQTGTYQIRVQARCTTHPSATSGWSAPRSVNVIPETITTPTLSGPVSGLVDTEYTFTAGGAVSNGGHPLEYIFDWGDGSVINPQDAATAAHAWPLAGTYAVRVRAQCKLHNDAQTLLIQSAWSNIINFSIPEQVSKPATPTGPATAQQGLTYTFKTAGATSNAGHTIQYQFDWGDGTLSGWGSLEQTHAWNPVTPPANYNVRVRARCVTDPAVISVWSDSVPLTVMLQEKVTTPFTPSGPITGVVATAYTYTGSGSSSSYGHQVEYQFDWGLDGDLVPGDDAASLSGWTAAPQTVTFAAAGTYRIFVRARCAEDLSLAPSAWSVNYLTMVVSPLETVSTPVRPSGAVEGVIDTLYAYATGGAATSDGHEVEYQFDWDDDGDHNPATGVLSLWSQDPAAQHGWVSPSTGTGYQVRARARCRDHADKLSAWSDILYVTVRRPETLTKPFIPAGITNGVTAASYPYTADGSASSDAHLLEYRFDWDDDGDHNPATGGLSPWTGDMPQDHIWSAVGSRHVRAQARCAEHTTVVSAWSDALVVTIVAETVSTPPPPSGPVDGIINTVYQYTAGGSTSNDGHALEYQFDWGDGSVSAWSSAVVDLHGWAAASAPSYALRVRARCADHPGVVSAWSTALPVTIVAETFLSGPAAPAGTVSPVRDTFYAYTASGAATSLAHPIEYRFDWGDGELSGWSTTTSQQHSWEEVGTALIRVQARCRNHPTLVSAWSAPLTVTVIQEVVSQPALAGPASGNVDETYSYAVSGASSNGGHPLEYQFDWGDGTTSDWSDVTTASHIWRLPGSYAVRVTARCRTHPSTTSLPSSAIVVAIRAETIARPDPPSGPAGGVTSTTYTYSTPFAQSDDGHPVVYIFRWGDGSQTETAALSAQKSWYASGVYQVTVQRRCQLHGSVYSLESLPLEVTILREDLTKPGEPVAPLDSRGVAGVPMTFTVSTPSTSSLLHPVEYQFSWGDGSAASAWSSSLSQSHTYDSDGSYLVRVTARCATDPQITIQSDYALAVVIETPFAPVGRSSGVTGDVLSYYTGGAALSSNIGLQYQFDWGDGSYSAWIPATRWYDEAYADYTWTAAGTYQVRARAGFADGALTTGWSESHEVVIEDEVIEDPEFPVGTAKGVLATLYRFDSRDSSSNGDAEDHGIEYRFDWGDGTFSPWTAPDPITGFFTDWHGWAALGIYYVRVQARCAVHNTDLGWPYDTITDWSDPFQVTIIPERITQPMTPHGPFSGVIGVSYSYEAGAAISSDGHELEYRFNWGDGTLSSWSTALARPHIFGSAGIFPVQVQARCRQHPGIISAWSHALPVTVGAGGESVTSTTPPAGPPRGVTGTSYAFTAGTAASSLGHGLQYRFDWGDGTQSAWGSASASHVFALAGSYAVSFQARCSTHTAVVSDWSWPLAVEVTAEEVTQADPPAGPETAATGVSLTYALGGAETNTDPAHPVQYRVDWDDDGDHNPATGALSAWTSATALSHTWSTPGLRHVRVHSRCATHTGVVARSKEYPFGELWSGILAVHVDVAQPGETVSAPFQPSGQTSGVVATEYPYVPSGARSSDGHSLEYRFDWGDGSHSEWVAGDPSHVWAFPGIYPVRAQARCADHNDVVSPWSEALVVAIAPEFLSLTFNPSGPASGQTSIVYRYVVGGSVSNDGHPLQYRFAWGDGTVSKWSDLPEAEHGWTSPGTYIVEAQARCRDHATDPDHVHSFWSARIRVTIEQSETVTQPFAPSGVTSGVVATPYLYVTAGGGSSDAHAIEYRYDWDDDGDHDPDTGTLSPWSSSPEVAHGWANPGTFQVRVQARCAEHTSAESPWSDYLEVGIEAETVSTPSAPVGVTGGIIYATYEYATGDSATNDGHPVEYQFSWGDGSVSEWSTSLTQSHGWSTAGTFQVKTRARCQDHPGVASGWSTVLVVTILDETVSTPRTPSGPAVGVIDTFYPFTLSGSASSQGHTVEYQVDWGNGTTSEWSSDTEVLYKWPYYLIGLPDDPGDLPLTYNIRARARCKEHPSAASGWSNAAAITIVEETISRPSLAGPDLGRTGEEYFFEVSGAVSNGGHPLEYIWHWDDGTVDYSVTDPTEGHKWALAGCYAVQVQARCRNHDFGAFYTVSAWSSVHTFCIPEEVSQPNVPSGPIQGQQNLFYTFQSGGARSNAAHPVEYQFDWGDGTLSEWGSLSQDHKWDLMGNYNIRARARCLTHPDLVSEWSESFGITVTVAETITRPFAPAGPTDGVPLTFYSFTTGGSQSSYGHAVEYQFDWGDGTQSGWSTQAQTHAYGAAGAYQVRARARCVEDTVVLSAWSDAFTVTITAPERVSTPSVPAGPTSGVVDILYSFATDGSVTSDGHPVEYQFDWGDGTLSTWAASTTALHGYLGQGTYQVRARARCKDHTDAVSGWSGSLTVAIARPETVTAPMAPVGSTDGVVDTAYTYATGEAVTSDGHPLQYRFDWGDGTYSPWSDGLTAEHTWVATGAYTLRAQARCKTHPAVTSPWSNALVVSIDRPEDVSQPFAPAGPARGVPDTDYTYQARGSISDDGHALEYRFDWGDGSTSVWSAATEVSHIWVAVGSYDIRVQARCQEHPGNTSPWSVATRITISLETVSAPDLPLGQTSGIVDTIYAYTVAGSETSDSHVVEYRFDWGDGFLSEWTASGVASRGWATPGSYQVRAQARCQEHPGVVSAWSAALTVAIADERVTTPDSALGPVNGVNETIYQYCSGGGGSTVGHVVEYRFDWGDGNISSWSTDPCQGHGWDVGTETMSFSVRVQARCKEHTTAISGWSRELTVTVGPEFITAPELDGPTVGKTGIPYEFLVVTPGVSNGDHPIKYEFDWGDSPVYTVVQDTKAAHTWAVAGVYRIRVRAICVIHDELPLIVMSDWSNEVILTIPETVTAPTTWSGPSKGQAGLTYTVTTGGASSNAGHPVEYQFDWDDDGDHDPATGTLSEWGSSRADHSWPTVGKYSVKARARCLSHPEVVSGWSEPLAVEIIAAEVLSAPFAPLGPALGVIDTDYAFRTEGTVSSYGHALEYQFDWDDDRDGNPATGNPSPWSDQPQIHRWLFDAPETQRTFQIRARARCVEDTQVMSPWSATLTVTISRPELVTRPVKPAGPTGGVVDTIYEFVSGGSETCDGHPVEYLFDWGDGTVSQWSELTTASHGWIAAGAFQVRVKARCKLHPSEESAWSEVLTVTIATPESVSRPFPPNGSAWGVLDTAYTFTLGGALSSDGHQLEYQVDWGDKISEWYGETEAAHIWKTAGTYQVKARARCKDHTASMSAWGDAHQVIIAAETVSKPAVPAGSPLAVKDLLFTYQASGAVSNDHHDLEYRFDWGDGTFSQWAAGGEESHGWTSTGSFQLRVKARCAAHPAVESVWSDPLSVTVAASEMVSRPYRPEGPVDGVPNTIYSFATDGSFTSTGEAVEYQFDFGDGVQSEWSAETMADHLFIAAGNFQVKARARCAAHPASQSVWSAELAVVISAETIAVPADPITSSRSWVTGIRYLLQTAPFESSQDHPLEYQFRFGDTGSVTMETFWVPERSFEYAWYTPGGYQVGVRARCAEHKTVMTAWSTALVTLANESMTAPTTPAGVSEGKAGVDYLYTTGGSVSSLGSAGHPAQYQLDWGDGTLTDWLDASALNAAQAAHQWPEGSYSLRARARCKLHPAVGSDWSGRLMVSMIDVEIPTPDAPSGSTAGLMGEVLTYTFSGGTSPGLTVRYRVDWDDDGDHDPETNPPSAWGGATATHSWAAAGTYQVRVQAGYEETGDAASAWSDPLGVTILLMDTSLVEALDASGPILNWDTGSSNANRNPWYFVADASAVDGDAARSGAVGARQWSNLFIQVQGPGVISFRWKVVGDTGDVLSFKVDDRDAFTATGVTGWATKSKTLERNKVYNLNWVYWNERVTSSNPTDAGFLDNLSWTPGGSGTLAGSLTLLEPHGGETWKRGSTQTVTWTSSDLPEELKVEIQLLRLKPGGRWATIPLRTVANSGEAEVPLPDTLAKGTYKMRLRLKVDPGVMSRSWYLTIR
jgi:hypothetical protein